MVVSPPYQPEDDLPLTTLDAGPMSRHMWMVFNSSDMVEAGVAEKIEGSGEVGGDHDDEVGAMMSTIEKFYWDPTYSIYQQISH